MTIPNLSPMHPTDPRHIRLRQVLTDLAISQTQLATAANVDVSVLSRALSGGGSLERHWANIAEYLAQEHRVSMEWLLAGKGNQRGRTEEDDRLAILTQATPPSPQPLSEYGTVTTDNILVLAEPGRYHPVRGNSVVQVADESMSPLIRSGQWAVTATPEKRKPRDGDIVVFQTQDGLAYVRRMREALLPESGKAFLLEAINKDKAWRTVVCVEADVRKICVVVGVLFE